MSKQTKTSVLGATGVSPWHYFDSDDVDIAVVLTPAATITYTVEACFSDPNRRIPATFSRTTTTVTVTAADHGLSVGDSAIVYPHTADSNIDGTRAVASVVDANNFTYTVADSGLTGGQCAITPLTAVPTTDMAAKTADAYASYRGPITAMRLNVTWTSGKATLSTTER